MTAPASRVEVHKLAHELGVEHESLAYLESLPADQLVTLRHGVSRAVFAANEHRLKPLGALARRVPATLAARIAKAALGPLLCGRVASVMDPRTAVPLAGHLDPDFLAQVTLSIDPARSAAIITQLDHELVVAVGERLIESGDYMVLARFITVVDEDIVLRLVELAEGPQLLEVALYADDHARVDELLQAIPEAKLAAVIEAAATSEDRADAAVSLLTMLSAESQRRLTDLAATLAPAVADAVVGATVRLEVWPVLLPVVGSLAPGAIARFVNVATLLDPALVDDLVVSVRRADESGQAGQLPFRTMLDVLEVADEEHRAMLREVTQLDHPATLAWAARSSGTSEADVRAALAALRAGEPLPS